jgi:xylan 1,4-beta-xylosidase
MYSWFNVDRSFDYILSLGMRPYVEIGFMPKLLASGTMPSFVFSIGFGQLQF